VTRLAPLLSRRALAEGRRSLRRTAQRLAGRHRLVIVPLLEPEHTRHALELACRLAAQRGLRRPFSRDVWSVLNDAPCPVMIATGNGAVPERTAA
jgi:hypothetical protein